MKHLELQSNCNNHCYCNSELENDFMLINLWAKTNSVTARVCAWPGWVTEDNGLSWVFRVGRARGKMTSIFKCTRFQNHGDKPMELERKGRSDKVWSLWTSINLWDAGIEKYSMGQTRPSVALRPWRGCRRAHVAREQVEPTVSGPTLPRAVLLQVTPH